MEHLLSYRVLAERLMIKFLRICTAVVIPLFLGACFWTDILGVYEELSDRPFVTVCGIAVFFVALVIPWKKILARPIQKLTRWRRDKCFVGEIQAALANISPYNPYPFADKRFAPAQYISEIQDSFDCEFEDNPRFKVCSYRTHLSLARHADVTFNSLSAGNDGIVESIEIRLNNESYQFAKDMMRGTFSNSEVNMIENTCFWISPTGLTVLLSPAKYAVVAHNGCLPLKYDEVDSLVRSDREATQQLLGGRRVCWIVSRYERASNTPRVVLDEGDSRNSQVVTEDLLGMEDYLEVCGTLHVDDDGTIAVLNAVIVTFCKV
jgi:hypothetical protein